MNAAADDLGMADTRYTDPSGFDDATVSTAADQVRIVERAMSLPVFASIVATPSATLPVAGSVRNTNTLLGQGGFVGVKTGSTDAAGGCFAFRAVRMIGGRRTTITGVVLGIARVAGETAPLLILVGYSGSFNGNMFSGSQGSLPLEIKQQFQNINESTGAVTYHLNAQGQRVAGSVANYAPGRMWATALTLILIVLALNLLARFVGRFSKISK